jgi:phenylpropionate dioxygenase-like ring-hydroxylating dioxygenase large terminal subunit
MSPELAAILKALPPCEGQEAVAPMLPKQCYTSAEFFDFEREAVFARNWVCVGRTDQLSSPGDAFSFSIAGEPLIIVRNKAGDIRAMGAVCQHRGHVLSCGGDNPKGLIRCPLHFWTYDLDGRLVGAPRMGHALAGLRDTVRLPAVRSGIWHGFIFVNLSGDAPPFGAEPCQGRALLGELSRDRDGDHPAGAGDKPAAVELENPARKLHRRLSPRICPSRHA